MTVGSLSVVGTPIGNLDDLSTRARSVLGTVPVVVAEDTRRTRILLTHIGASPRVLSYHAHSTPERVEEIIEILADGEDVALVTDAGTPGISDPGFTLVRAARQQGFFVSVVPGPSAVAAALSCSGLPADRYAFLGFLPRKGTDRRELVAGAGNSPWTTVIFEAPGRLGALFADLEGACGTDREAAVARELTKVHEELKLGTISDLRVYYDAHPPRGEVTVMVAGQPRAPVPLDRDAIAEAARSLLDEGHSRRDVAKQLATELGVARNEVYRIVTEL